MTDNYHTPIPEGAPANAQTFNDPLGQMDEALSEALLAERDGHIIQEEGVDLAQQPRLNFTGAGVTVTNAAGKTIVTIPLTDISGLLAKTGLTEWDEQGSDPATPGANKWKVYFKAGGLYIKDDAGVVIGPLSTGGALIISSASVTTANVTGVEGTLHNLDVSGMTANRDFNLPTPSAAGKRIGVRLSVGDATYALLLKVNGVEWSRIFITGEIVIFVSTGTGAADWAIEQDGRIPCVCKIKDTQTMNITNNSLTLINLDETDNDNASLADTANDRIVFRRTGAYRVSAFLRYDTLAANAARVNASIRLNGGATYPLTQEVSGLLGGIVALTPSSDNVPFSAGDYIELYGLHQSGSTEATYVSGVPTSLSVSEILK